MLKTKFVVFAVAVGALAGCEIVPALLPLPEVNDANCATESIRAMEDKGQREEFAGLCLRRGGFKKSKAVAW